MPNVTVLMPVFNGEKYLRKAIDSILNQDYTNFEFLIINDGSTDKSTKIIKSYNDKRIKLVNNPYNKGLVYSLNLGIEMAQGKYIARMDCDDISLPSRLKKQVDLLEKTKYALVASKIITIDKNGKELGLWVEDQRAITPEKIRSQLPKGNCLAHPSIMVRSNIIRKYLYNSNQNFYTEDYDLWLRMVSDGNNLGKVNEVLLKYRIHPLSWGSSTTSWLKRARTRLNYLQIKIKQNKLKRFDLLVFIYMFPEVYNYVYGKVLDKLRSLWRK